MAGSESDAGGGERTVIVAALSNRQFAGLLLDQAFLAGLGNFCVWRSSGRLG